ncbi:SDR family oxidoreductase [Nonomuraea sp. SYSU D8015]|uniref:SDR family oxidoreductase n=1 Tax=Nonomuraea sp. SYSU D8015 TaxID=2593644 RepID=UPI001CB73CEE|nr:NAD(P)H-binding protein [Nonomuraea sp. SYSU D8015]
MTILATGATGVVGRGVVGRGVVGRGVVAELLKAGRTVRALTRRPATAGLPGEVEVYEGDLDRPESVRAALAGVERLYLFPVAHTAAEVVALAVESGVRRIVDLSGAGAEDELFEDGYRVVERAVEASRRAGAVRGAGAGGGAGAVDQGRISGRGGGLALRHVGGVGP